MTKDIFERIEGIRNDKTLCCTKPWTTLEEVTVYGEYKVCCWLRNLIGQIPKDSRKDFMELWDSPRIINARRTMSDSKSNLGNLCDRTFCEILYQRDFLFRRYEFWDYTPEEYRSFGEAFRKNRKLTVSAIEQRKLHPGNHPTHLKLTPSHTCNLHCRMCMQDSTYKAPSGDAYLKNVFSLMPYLEDLLVVGGEPFACGVTKRILFGEEIMGYPQIHCSVITNGTLLDDRMQDKLRHLRLGFFHFSLDSCHAKTYHEIHEGAVFSITIANLKKFIARAKAGEIRVKHIFASFVIQRANFEEIPEFIEFTHALGIQPIFSIIVGSSELQDFIPKVKQRVEEGIKKADESGSTLVQNLLRCVLAALPRYEAVFRQQALLDRLPINMNNTMMRKFFSRHRRIYNAIKYALDSWRPLF